MGMYLMSKILVFIIINLYHEIFWFIAWSLQTVFLLVAFSNNYKKILNIAFNRSIWFISFAIYDVSSILHFAFTLLTLQNIKIADEMEFIHLILLPPILRY